MTHINNAQSAFITLYLLTQFAPGLSNLVVVNNYLVLTSQPVIADDTLTKTKTLLAKLREQIDIWAARNLLAHLIRSADQEKEPVLSVGKIWQYTRKENFKVEEILMEKGCIKGYLFRTVGRKEVSKASHTLKPADVLGRFVKTHEEIPLRYPATPLVVIA